MSYSKYFSNRKPPLQNHQFTNYTSQMSSDAYKYNKVNKQIIPNLNIKKIKELYKKNKTEHDQNKKQQQNHETTQNSNRNRSIVNNFSFSMQKQIKPKLQYFRKIRNSIESLQQSIQNSRQHLADSGILFTKKDGQDSSYNTINSSVNISSLSTRIKVKSDFLNIKFNYNQKQENKKKGTQLIFNQNQYEKNNQEQIKSNRKKFKQENNHYEIVKKKDKLQNQNNSYQPQPTSDRQNYESTKNEHNRLNGEKYYEKMTEQSFQRLLGQSFDVDSLTHQTQYSFATTPFQISPRNHQSFIKKQKSKEKLRKLEQRLKQLKKHRENQIIGQNPQRQIQQEQRQKILIMDRHYLPSPIHKNKREELLAKNASFIEAKSLKNYKNVDQQQQIQEDSEIIQQNNLINLNSYRNKNKEKNKQQQKSRNIQQKNYQSLQIKTKNNFLSKMPNIDWRKPKNYAQIQHLVNAKKKYRVDQLKDKFSPQKSSRIVNNHNKSYSYSIEPKSAISYRCYKEPPKFDKPKQEALKIRQFIQQMLKVKIIQKYMSITDLTYFYWQLKKSNVPHFKWKNFIIDQVYKKMKNTLIK